MTSAETNEPILLSTAKKTFKILQITDNHLFRMGIYDRVRLKRIQELCVQWGADIVVHTGDLFGYNGCDVKVVKKILLGVDNSIGTVAPWAFAWGNHDHCLCDKVKIPCQFGVIEEFMEALPNSLYRQSGGFFKAKKTPSEEGTVDEDALPPREKGAKNFFGGNYAITLQNEETKAPLWNFYMFNSCHEEGITDDALKWMVEVAGKQDDKVPGLAFYHVPNFEYNTIWDKGLSKGMKEEKVCHSKDDGRMHKAFKEFGQIKGCFVGHDHINDYYGELDGVVYAYGRKTGTHGYGGSIQEENYNPDKKKMKQGGKLITLYLEEGTWDLKSVFSDGTTWNESKKMKI